MFNRTTYLFIALISFASPLTYGASTTHIWTFDDHAIGVKPITENITQLRIAEELVEESDFQLSPMILDQDFGDSPKFEVEENTFKSSSIRIKVLDDNKCIEIFDVKKSSELTQLCINFKKRKPKFTMKKGELTHVYGLGEQFINHGSANGDWVSHGERYPGNSFGNEQVFLGLEGGKVGNAEFPIMYAVGPENLNFALMLDSHYPNIWNFEKDPWKVTVRKKDLRIILITGKDLPELRQTFMKLTGTPPVPPRKMFGLWVSEYGYENWEEVDKTLKPLNENKFPLDGFILDLQWFGGIKPPNKTQMGTFDWDLNAFPEPAEKINELKQKNIGIITIEEPYIGNTVENHEVFAELELLVAKMDSRKCVENQYEIVEFNSWWGEGAMLDFTNNQTNIFIHDELRVPNIINKGVIGHWTDLGEPEDFNIESCYFGFGPERQHISHRSIHNFYNLFWSKGIYEGYYRNRDTIKQRPFIMTRSGTIGSQRYGTVMWSGDIGSDIKSLKSQYNAQLHMSLSGVDYFGSDIGGFKRLGGYHLQKNSYTQWFANSAWLDVPVRPHSFNLDNDFQTSPAEMGHLESNLANIRERYRWTPYYYSLAYRAFLYGEPMFPPALYYYQNDKELAGNGYHKMIGKDVLIRAFAKSKPKTVSMYLPKGTWYNYRTNEKHVSNGEEIADQPVRSEDKLIQVPVFIRAGAIIPQMPVLEAQVDAYGHSAGLKSTYKRIIRFYPDKQASTFTLYEDDGKTIQYDDDQRPKYATRTTRIKQVSSKDEITLNIEKANGDYDGAPTLADYQIIVVSNQKPSSVTFNGKELSAVEQTEQLGWYKPSESEIAINLHQTPLNEDLEVKISF